MSGTNDEIAVRRAIERFRAAYNVRLDRHERQTTGNALIIRDCTVVIRDNGAEVTCVDDGGAAVPREWVFRLRRGDDTWNIESVEPR